MLVSMMAFNAVAIPYLPFLWAKDKAENDAVSATLGDPGFVRRAAGAGFRVELATDARTGRVHHRVLAKCARSNEAGPLPCGGFPEDPDHPGIPVEIRI